MYTKYEIKTYQVNQTNSNFDQKKNLSKNTSKYYENIENSEKDSEPLLGTTFHPKSIFTKQNNNISFYQSSSLNNFKNSKNKETNKIKSEKITPIMKTKNKNKIYNIKKTEETNEENTIQNFSYNYSDIIDNKARNNRTIKNNINNINININPNTNNFNFNNCNNIERPKRINLNEKIVHKNKRKRATKSYKKQLNVQKRDDFNVLSYQQPEAEFTDTVINDKKHKNKIIKLYKKQEVDEIFFPSKRTHSPSITKNRKEEVEKYQTHTLKYQSFFGSFNCNKKEKMKKSISKKKINQLNDFNIDKLIEIGDKYANLHQPVLPLGKIMNNNILFFHNKIKKNKFQIPINTSNNCFNYSKYSRRTYNSNAEEDKENIPNLVNDKNRVTKKLISKNNLRSSKNSKDKINDKIENQKLVSDDNTARKYLNFNNENPNPNQNSKIDIPEENNDNNKTNSSVIIRRRNIKNNSGFLRKQNSYDTNIKDNNLEEIIPKTKYQKITGDLSLNASSINSNAKYIILNKNKKAHEKSIEIQKEKLITDVVKYNRNNSRKKIEQNNNRQILIDINVKRRNDRYRNDRINQNKTKNYYGYDDRHNLEDTINNHAYYESMYYKKV